MNVVDRLRTIRLNRRFSQEDIAAVLETTQQQYSKYENGKNVRWRLFSPPCA